MGHTNSIVAMAIDISERAFEDAIEAALLRHGPDEIGGVSPVVE